MKIISLRSDTKENFTENWRGTYQTFLLIIPSCSVIENRIL